MSPAVDADPPRVAVLGATGSVGRSVCAAFAREGWEVVGIARRAAPDVPTASFADLDIPATSSGRLAGVLEAGRVRAVVNATGGWGRTEQEMVYAHVRLVERLLEAAALVPWQPRIVHVGSIHEYGPVPAGVSIGEDLVPQPDTVYARTKLAGSQAILDATRAGAVRGVVLRAVNVYGPRTTPASFLGMVLAKLRAARAGQEVALTIADARRDFVDVRDLARAVVQAACVPAVGRVVNIGRGEALDLRELVSLLVRAAGLPPGTVREEAAQVESKGGGWTQADIRLAGQLLRWSPHISIHESIRAMWEAAGENGGAPRP